MLGRLIKIGQAFWKELIFLYRHPKRPLLALVPLILFWCGMNLANYLSVAGESSCDLREVGHSNRFERWSYDWLMARRFPEGPAGKVALITIAEGSEPYQVLTNTCEARRFLTPLVERVSQLGASVIALDMSYSENSCTNEDVNRNFVSALGHSKSAVVVGQATHRRHMPKHVQDSDNCLVLTEGYDFEKESEKAAVKNKVKSGLIRLNNNASKIPLRWWVFPKDGVEGDSETKDLKGFAFMAAQAAITHENQMGRLPKRVDLEDDETLKPYFKTGTQPYTSFRDIPTWTAMDVLCYAPEKSAVVADQCGDKVGHIPVEGKLQDRVVVIGEEVDADRPEADGVPRYGADLQANYVEALLDKRYVHEWLISLHYKDYVIPGDYIVIAFFVLLMIVFDGMVARKRIQDWEAFSSLWATLAVMIVGAAILLDRRGIFMPYLFLSFLPFSVSLLGKIPFMMATRIQGKVER